MKKDRGDNPSSRVIFDYAIETANLRLEIEFLKEENEKLKAEIDKSEDIELQEK